MGSRAKRHRRLNGAWALLAVVALLAGTLAEGHSYFQCARMGPVGFVACCGHHDAADSQAAIDVDACCHSRDFASPDHGFALAPRGVAPAPLVAVEAGPTLALESSAAPRPVEVRSARAGPARSSPNDHRIRLRVSLT